MFAGGAVAEVAAAAAARGWLRSSGKTPLLRWRGGISLKEAGALLFRGSAAASRRRPAPGGEEGAAARSLAPAARARPAWRRHPRAPRGELGCPPLLQLATEVRAGRGRD